MGLMPCLLYSIWDWGRSSSHLVCAHHLALLQLVNPAEHEEHLEMLLREEGWAGGREGGREGVSRRKIWLLGQGQR